MRPLIIGLLAVLLFAVPALASEQKDTGVAVQQSYNQPMTGPLYSPGRDVLYDNGPIVSNPTYPDLSIRQDVTLGSTVNGFGHQLQSDIRISDDFEIPVGEEWLIETITFYAYQTGSTTTPTITSVVVKILDGPPDDPLSNVVYGDLITNRMISTAWTGIYRSPESSLPGFATNRPIMVNVCDIDVQLGSGQYWLVWMSDGTLTSGPWTPPVCIWDTAMTGDAWQYYLDVWDLILDDGDGGNKGIPFIIEGTVASPVEETSWGSIKALFL